MQKISNGQKVMKHTCANFSPGQSFGSILERREVNDLIFTEAKYIPNTYIPRHFHKNAYFCLVLTGEYFETFKGSTVRCVPSTVVFHPPEQLHSNRFQNSTGVCFNIELGTKSLNRISEFAENLSSPRHCNGGHIARLGAKIYKEFNMGDCVSNIAIEGLTLELTAESSRDFSKTQCKHIPPWLKRAEEILNDSFQQQSRLSDIAKIVGVHPVHLAREFHKYLHCTVGEYIRRLRIDYARQQLAESTLPLVEIALAAGFANQSHFSRTFKLNTGMTPSEYRRLLI